MVNSLYNARKPLTSLLNVDRGASVGNSAARTLS